MTPPEETRLECLKLALSLAKERPSYSPNLNVAGGLGHITHAPPTAAQVVSMADAFEAFVTKRAVDPWNEPGAIAKAIDDVLRNKVPSLVKDAMGAAYDP